MVAVREQILVTLKTLLVTIPGVTVTRSLDREVTVFPSINIVPGAQEAGEGGEGSDGPFGVTQYLMDVTTELYVGGATSEAADTALHALYTSVVKKIKADDTFGGLAVRTDEQGMDDPQIGAAEGQGPTSGVAVDWLVTYWTVQGDPETVAP